jgi:hypothetical protein
MGIMDSAGDLAAVVAFLGTLSLLGAVGVTIYFIVRDIQTEFFPSPVLPPLARPIHPRPKSVLPPQDHNTNAGDPGAQG